LRAYWFIRRPDVRGVKCVLTDGDRVLLVRHTYGNRSWDLPGGAVRRGEPPHETARREMEEELGVHVERFNHLGQIRAWIDFRRDTIQLFHAELGDRPIAMDPCELAAVDWFSRGALPTELGRFVVRILAVLPA
jgi:8-oxo-dGTP pyrophosphatase MutT (NUDIX family)